MTEATLLDAILDPGGLSVVFQPIFEIGGRTSRVHSLEALVRGPKGTNLEAADVLFEYVRRKREESLVDRACATAVFEAVRKLPESVDFGLNVHAATLGRDFEFLNFLGDTAERFRVSLSRLTVELVEHAPPWEGPAFSAVLDALRQIGVRIALDDVGLGQSNYRMILDCKPDYFKVDRYFVKGVHRDFHRQAVLDSVNRLAHSFGARVVAEGVEEAPDLATLETLGIDLVQGHLLLAARPGDDLVASGLLGGVGEASAADGGLRVE